jgi:hypothetical protein
MNSAIKKIELDLGGKTVELTPQQAQNLKEALDDLFGKEIVVQREYVQPFQPLPYVYPYPIWEWRPPRTGDFYWSGDAHTWTAGTGTLKLTG